MRFSRFFIDRPIFAAVLSIVVFSPGRSRCSRSRSASTPRSCRRRSSCAPVYPGANPRVLAETVATPLEEQINGVENMLYMSSQATSDGVLTLTVTFRIGTDVDLAQVQVQNRVSQALPRLPEEVRQLGVTTVKSSPDLTMVVHLVSPDDRYDMVYLRNYAVLQVKDVLARINGVGQVRVFGARRLRHAGLARSRRRWRHAGSPRATWSRAIREQNVQVAAGVVGAPPMPEKVEYQLTVNAHGRLARRGGVRRHHHQDRRGRRGDPAPRCGADRARRRRLRAALAAQQQGRRRHSASSRRRGPTRSSSRPTSAQTMEELKPNFPQGVDYQIVYDPTINVRDGDPRGGEDAARGDAAGGDRRGAVPADLARVDHPAGGGAGLHRRHVRRSCWCSDSRSTPCRCSGWCWRSASWWTTPSWWWRTWSATSRPGYRRATRRTRPWRKSAGRSSPSRWCCAPCSCRWRSSAASPGSSTGSSR